MNKYALASGVLALILATAAGAAGARTSTKHTQPARAIAWKTCANKPGLKCGALRVPRDWANPRGATITLRLNLRPADRPDQRVGSLFYHPGGPGDGAMAYVDDAKLIFTPALLARFDIIGIDPRGFGASTPVRCSVPLTVPGVTLFPHSEAAFQRMVEHNRAVGRSCLKQTGPLLGHVDAESVARDYEAVRSALGIPKINLLAVSYGVQVGAIYAQLYPQRVRAMVLDATLEHDLSDALATAASVSTIEDSFDRFARWCTRAPTCALHGQDVGRVFDRLVDRADRHPIPVKGAIRPVTGEDIRFAAERGLYFKTPGVFGPSLSWAAFALAIKRAVAGDASAFAAAPPEGHADREYSAQATLCMDYPSDVHTYAQMQTRMQMGRELSPHLQGASQAWTLLRCVGWPLKATNPRRHLHVRGVPPVLIINATHDPNTTYAWAYGIAGQIEGSVVLTRVGDGHTSTNSSACARAAVDHYLIAGTTPTPDQVCH
jgi:pimeloyl-ACP methyl ester carboxylesterase